MKKKKILRILNRFNVGGPIYNAAYLTKYINKEVYETLLIGGKHESHEQSAEYILNGLDVSFKQLKFMRRAISPLFDLISLIQIIIIIYKFKPHIIHTHAAKSGLLGRLASLLYYKKVRLVHTYHGNVFEGYFSNFKNKILIFIERFLASKSTKIIAISKSQKEDLVNKYAICDESKISIIPLGFDLKKFSVNTTEKRAQIRNKYNVIDKEILITIIGRLVPIKNHKLFVDVIKYCKNKTNVPIKALVIGDGPEMSNLIKHAEYIGLDYGNKNFVGSYDIFFCSWQKEIDSFLAASDIVALTSDNEGTPVSIIESMSSGTASISTNVGGVVDIIDHKISGVISNNKVKCFGDDLIELIENKKIIEKISKNGKSISLKLFNYKVLVNNMENLYKSL